MKRKVVRRTVVILSFAAVLAALLPAAYGQSCSLTGVAGSYADTDSGMVIGVGLRVGLAKLTLDSAGNINGKVTASLNGSVTHMTLSGTYTVKSDCTGTTTFSEFDQSGNLVLTATVEMVWDDSMQEIRFIFTSAVLPDGTALPTAINGDARKTASPRQESDGVALKGDSPSQRS